jgi:hypothetical protein
MRKKNTQITTSPEPLTLKTNCQLLRVVIEQILTFSLFSLGMTFLLDALLLFFGMKEFMAHIML